MKTIFFGAIITLISLAACCHSKKQQAQPPAAKDVLKDRNTKDPKIDSLNKPVEKINPEIKPH